MIRLRNALSLTLLAAGVLGMASCDKAKLAVKAAQEKFRGATDPGAPVAPGGEVATELVSQVDTAAEGVRFRRDLAFPQHVNVRVVEEHNFQNMRRTMNSALGSETAELTTKLEVVALAERRANHVSFAIERSGVVADKTKEDKKAEAAAAANEGAMPKIDFELGPRGWRAPVRKGPTDFQLMTREKAMLPSLESSISNNGLAARKQWFSASRRWAAGDRLVLEGDSLGVLFPPNSTGKVTLVYEVAEPIDGHPCARFSLSGDVDTKDQVSLTGEVLDSKSTIKSGKVWCSLLYPLVLREEIDAVVTVTEGRDGVKSRIQGSAKSVTTYEWKPVTEG
jgi:hypothetical protein